MHLDTPKELVSFLDQSLHVRQSVRAARTLGERAERIAQGLRLCFPALLTACFLRSRDEAELRVVDGGGRLRQLSRQEQEWQAGRGDLADLMDVVSHAFNNVLNDLLLHLTVIEQSTADAELRAKTTAIRKKGFQDVNLLRKLQRYSRAIQP